MSSAYRGVVVIQRGWSAAVIKLTVTGLFCTVFSLFSHAFPAEALERESSFVDLAWHLPNTVKPAISFKARALRQEAFSNNGLFTGDITITGRAEQMFVICAEEVITDHFDSVSVVADSDYLHVLQLATTTGELTILNGKNCPDGLARHYPYDMAQLVRSTEPFLVIRKEKTPSSYRNDNRQLSILPSNSFEPKETLFITQSGTGSGFDDHNDFKRPPYMPMLDKTMANLILLPTLNLPANWRDYLPFTGIYHWLTEQSEAQAGLTLLVHFDGQPSIALRISQAEYPAMAEHLLNARQLLQWLAPKLNGRESFIQKLMDIADDLVEASPIWDNEPFDEIQRQLSIVLEQPDTEFSLVFESHQLAHTLLPASLEKAIIQLPYGTGSGQSASLSGSHNSDSSPDSGQPPQEKQPDRPSEQGRGAGDGKKPPKQPVTNTDIPMATFGAFRFDLQSAHDICDRAEEVMIYGFQHCRYTQVTEAIKSDCSPFKKVYDCSIGGPYAPEEVMTTLEGGRFYQVDIKGLDRDNNVRRLKQYCKAGLVNLIIENVKRAKQQKKLIPALLIIDIDGNQHRLTPDAVSNKKYTFVTMAELRRIYKLCNDPKLDPKIKEIAAATFKFAKTCKHHDKEGIFSSLEQIEPFWKSIGWAEAWQARMGEAEKEEKSESEVEKRAYWRDQLNGCLNLKWPKH